MDLDGVASAEADGGAVESIEPFEDLLSAGFAIRLFRRLVDLPYGPCPEIDCCYLFWDLVCVTG